jgi:hypothetical protein
MEISYGADVHCSSTRRREDGETVKVASRANLRLTSLLNWPVDEDGLVFGGFGWIGDVIPSPSELL